MSINTWTPEAETATFSIDQQWLEICADWGNSDDLDKRIELLDDESKQHKAVYMRLSDSQWRPALAECSNEQLLGLIRFFTRAEALLSGWEAGDKSPAIAANKELRRRGEKLDRAMLLWLRENSDNRYIPNGGL